MDIHVYDTYVKAKDGHTMHFDVITNVQDHDKAIEYAKQWLETCLLYTSPSPRDRQKSRMPSSA